MSKHASNILEFAALRREIEEGEEPLDKIEELQAISGCLDYLCGELRRMDQRLAARLIGAASESLRQEIRRDAQRGNAV